MGGIHRSVDANGTVTFSDRPFAPDPNEQARPGSRPARDKPRQDRSDNAADDYIKELRKRIPKLNDYLEYLDYLRHNRPLQLDRVLQELKDQDPDTWLKLQKYPQFRPLRNTALGLQAAEKNIGLGLGLALGNKTGSVEKWLESSVKEMMKRDRWGPYADVLGAKASTLAAPETSYSNSRLGQYLKTEDAKAGQAAKVAAKAVEESRAAVRGALASAVSRPGNVLIDVGMAALKPETGVAATNILMRRRIEQLARRNPEFDIDTPAYFEARGLLSQGRYGELDTLLKRYE